MTIWLVTTRDLKLQQNEKMVETVSVVLGWIVIFLLKKNGGKIYFSWRERARFVKKLHLELENFGFFGILKFIQNNGLKSSKNDGF